MKYRDHTGGYDESMATVQELENEDQLLAHLIRKYGYQFTRIEIEPYSGIDDRNGWDTHIVKAVLPSEEVLPVGFSDGTFSTDKHP